MEHAREPHHAQRAQTEPAAERREAYLLALADALRPLADPAEIQEVAAQLLGEELQASRIHYAEVVEGGRFGIVRADYHPGMSSVVGRHRFDDYGPTAMSEFRAGRILIVENAEEDPRLDERERTATRRLDVAAYVMVPLVKEGAAVALLVAHQRSPRAWTADEVALMHETAERTWAAVERAHAEAALHRTAASLRHTQERLRLALDCARAATWEWDLRTDKNTWSEGLWALYGLSPGSREASYEVWRETIHPEDRETVERRVREAARTGSDLEVEWRVVTAGGGVRWLTSRGRPIRDENGTVTHYLGIVLDETERKDSERRRVVLEEQLRQAQKLESVGRLAGGIAHDFNNLLTVILGSADALEGVVPAAEPSAVEDLQRLQLAAERASDLTRQLLAFARKQVIAPVPLDLGKAVRDVHKLLSRVLGEHIAIVADVQDGLWPVLCDPGQLEQVILNLAVNARDAMEDGGQLWVSAANVEVRAGEAAPFSDASPGQYVRLSVRDSGCGISEDVRKHLFEPFFTTKPVGRGTGLGLATCYGIARQHGGSAAVESTPGVGTTVHVYFPRTDGVAAAPARVGVRSGGSEAILVVEDDRTVREVTVRALRAGGYRVTTVEHPREALALTPGELADVQLLLTDLVMPELDGRRLSHQLRERHPALRVLYVSGYTPENLVIDAADPGVGFLAKPFTAPTLLAKVRATLDAS